IRPVGAGDIQVGDGGTLHIDQGDGPRRLAVSDAVIGTVLGTVIRAMTGAIIDAVVSAFTGAITGAITGAVIGTVLVAGCALQGDAGVGAAESGARCQRPVAQ